MCLERKPNEEFSEIFLQNRLKSDTFGKMKVLAQTPTREFFRFSSL